MDWLPKLLDFVFVAGQVLAGLCLVYGVSLYKVEAKMKIKTACVYRFSGMFCRCATWLRHPIKFAMSPIFKVLIGFFAILATAGCAGARLQPDRLMGIQDAFPKGTDTSPPAAFSEAAKTNVLEAPYEDVFRAASVAASQAQFNVEHVQKSRGLILASRPVKMRPHGTSADYPEWQITDHAYFYAVSVRELGPKRTEVRISAKVQGRCGMWSAGMYVMTGGLGTAYFNEQNARCRELSSGMWAIGSHNTAQEMGQFLTFLRNNLLAAGML